MLAWASLSNYLPWIRLVFYADSCRPYVKSSFLNPFCDLQKIICTPILILSLAVLLSLLLLSLLLLLPICSLNFVRGRAPHADPHLNVFVYVFKGMF